MVQEPTPSPDPHPDRILRCLEILVDFSRMVAESADLQRLLQLTTLQAARGVGIRHTKIMRYRPEEGNLLIVVGVGWNPAWLAMSLPRIIHEGGGCGASP